MLNNPEVVLHIFYPLLPLTHANIFLSCDRVPHRLDQADEIFIFRSLDDADASLNGV